MLEIVSKETLFKGRWPINRFEKERCRAYEWTAKRKTLPRHFRGMKIRCSQFPGDTQICLRRDIINNNPIIIQ
jgi:hypothetical protein